jgi:hypothetical protein
VPVFENPKAISAGWGRTCAIDDAGVKYWGINTVKLNNDVGYKNECTKQKDITYYFYKKIAKGFLKKISFLFF